MKLSATRSNKGFTLVELLVVIAIIAALAAISTPMVFKQLKKSAMNTALSNGKQIGAAMLSFNEDYQSFPDERTAQMLNREGRTGNFTGSANAFFRQLIASRALDAETVFFAKDGRAIKPDDDIQGNNAVAPGECSFSYVMRQRGSTQGSTRGNGLSPGLSNTRLPVVATPMDTSGNSRFLLDPFDSRAIVIRLDNSGEVLRLRDDGTALDMWPTDINGRNLQQGHQAIHPRF